MRNRPASPLEAHWSASHQPEGAVLHILTSTGGCCFSFGPQPFGCHRCAVLIADPGVWCWPSFHVLSATRRASLASVCLDLLPVFRRLLCFLMVQPYDSSHVLDTILRQLCLAKIFSLPVARLFFFFSSFP